MNNLLLILGVNVVWYIYASLEGIIESHYFHKSKEANDFNNKLWLFDIHTWYTFRRVLFADLLVVILWLGLKGENAGIQGLMIGFSFMLSFPLFHNGFYYIVRKKLDPSINFFGFTTDDFNKDSSAKINVGVYLMRKILFLTSLCIVLASYLIFRV